MVLRSGLKQIANASKIQLITAVFSIALVEPSAQFRVYVCLIFAVVAECQSQLQSDIQLQSRKEPRTC